MKNFFLGVHHPNWLEQLDIPMFVSDATLRDRKTLPRARGLVGIDSGGFMELKAHGRWTQTPEAYAARARRYMQEIGNLKMIAIQDCMVEPLILKKTGKTVAQHQQATVDSFLRLRELAPEVPWMPVVQGWTLGQYLDCVELYDRHGVDLREQPIVGVGSICRRQETIAASHVIYHLASEGLRVHGFGFKTCGLKTVQHLITSADSMAWSEDGKHDLIPGHDKPGPGRPLGHKHCGNCMEWALSWRSELFEKLAKAPPQPWDVPMASAAE